MTATTVTSGTTGCVDIVLTADDAQLLMSALSELPFKRVFELIGMLNRQANAVTPGAPLVCALDPGAFALIVEALGQLPYQRVHVLIDDLKAQLHAARAAGERTSGSPVRAARHSGRVPGVRMP
ncbi:MULTISPECIES: hypothetical protein [Pandoraea]|uniref:hypothetical protein n=1 Tax=Pandoraea TaxID=93217 RepID=UPI001F5C1B0C|nr:MULTISPECIES: hypothetical protein [Pandoraea]MCI3207995.1 hypothetical protein [Pandoraea sp. LA3]MDN4586024.1 hypothetical protein [Pandoraea capi]